MILGKQDTNKIIGLLSAGKIGVMPADTIYGIHCLALNSDLADRVNALKNRPEEKRLINLIGNVSDLELFDIKLGDFEREQIAKFWPGKNTLIFENSSGDTISFRLPDDEFLIGILQGTGPLISTSANISGEPYAKTIDEAQTYFGDSIDFYVDAGEIEGSVSSVYCVFEDKIEQLR